MSEWCFVHAADTHLDTPMNGLRRIAPGLHERVLSASLDAFDDLVQLAIDEDAAFLTIAGDVYDGAERGARAQLRVLQGARRLDEAGIHLLIAHGNHDPVTTGWDGIGEWPERAHVFRTDSPETVTIERGGRVLCVVAGVSYARRDEQRNLARMFERTHHDVPHVAVLHANVGSNPDHAPYAPATVDDLRSTGYDYWALGHIHLRQDLATPATRGFWAHYPGNLQGRSPKPSERGAKGASLVRVVNGVVQQPELVVLDKVRFGEALVEIDDDTTIDELTDRLLARAGTALDESGGRILVLRGRVTGAGPLHFQLAREGVLDDLRRALDDQLPSTADAVWTSLKDRTSPPVEAEDVAGAVSVLDEVPFDAAAAVAEAAGTATRLGADEFDVEEVRAEALRMAEALIQETAR